MSEMVGRWTRGIEPDNRTIQEQQLTIKLAERDELLREVQWSGIYSYCTGWDSCPICGGIKPPQGMLYGELPNNSGHRTDCRLSKAIGEVDDE